MKQNPLNFLFRKYDYDNWRRNNFHQLVDPRLLISAAHNPLEYVASGYEISPFDSLNIHMKLHEVPLFSSPKITGCSS
jgi:hypothetical protein